MDIEKDGLPLASASASGFMTWHITESEPHRGVEQLVARRAHNPKVVGSSPTPATKKEQSEMVALFLLRAITLILKHLIYFKASVYLQA